MLDRWSALFASWEAASPRLAESLAVAAILVLAAVLYLALSRVVVRVIATFARRSRVQWDEVLVRHGVFHRLAAIAPGLLTQALASEWLAADGTAVRLLQLGAHLWILGAGLLAVYALLNGLHEIYRGLSVSKQIPIRGFVQGVKLVLFVVVLIISISLLLGRSPALLVSGFGAMTAVLMLVFKDPILGFVAGIQLSANRMLSVGDWLEMPRYNADGDVIDITLTTVKVRNWDQTITTVPTYALISDSFKNWRGMQEIGGRRIMRSLFIDMHSIHFLSPAEVARLRKAQLISTYIEQKIQEIEAYNREHQVDPASPVNGRRLTNIGTFRAYLMAYLKAHPGIHPDLIMMVRQRQPTPEGLPIEIYAFTRDTAWPLHEGVQSDLFDHVLAIAPEFGLRVFQMPSGSDVRGLVGAGRATSVV